MAIFISSSWRLPAVITLVIALLSIMIPTQGFADPKPRKGLFLVATDQLNGTSFQETVILLTHFSQQGATGLTINRPTDIPLNEALPNVQQLGQDNDPLFLGGPVNSRAIFVLVHTFEPNQGMHRITDDIYFSTGRNAFDYPINGAARAYAGYAGWAPGQLQHEIHRGDWLVVKTDPAIVFDKNMDGLWIRLKNRWSGNWI